MTFSAIVTAHDEDPRRILGVLRYQIRKPEEILLLCSGDYGDMLRLKEDFPEAEIWHNENREDWGHAKRAWGLEFAKGDVIGFFNSDDSYSNEYLERMMAEIEAGADVAYCAWNEIPSCGFTAGSSTSGNYIVRTDIARKAGYTDRHYEADGTFINRIAALTPNIVKVDEVLYFHNEVR